MPVFGRAGEDLACAFVRTNILLAHKNAGAPPMTPEQIEAVELVASVAAEPGMYVERQFEPGTIVFMHNHTIFHMRTDFEDSDDPALKRHLLRVWMSLPNSRRLPDSFKGFFGDVSPGAVRGGYPSQADAPVIATALLALPATGMIDQYPGMASAAALKKCPLLFHFCSSPATSRIYTSCTRAVACRV